MRSVIRPCLAFLLTLAAGCKASADTAEPVARSPYAPPAGPCEATTEPLDLNTLLERPECKRKGEPVPIDPNAVKVEMSPAPLNLADGERGSLEVRIINASEQPIELDIDLSCDPWRGFTLMALGPAEERRITFAQGVVGDNGRWQVFTVEEEACPQYPVRITVPPSGRLFMPIQFDPSFEWENRNLKLVDENPFGTGQYTLQAEVPVIATQPLVAKGVLRVQ